MTSFSIDHELIRINEKLTYSEYPDCPERYRGLLMNARLIQGIFADSAEPERYNRFGKIFDPERNTDELIEALPKWYAMGLRAITVGFQGGGPCYTIDNKTINNNPFSPDGKSIDESYLRRMKKIIDAADKIGMLVIVSFLYGAQSRFLKDDIAVISAVKTASNWLRDSGFTNVIIEVANEHNVPDFKCHPIVYTNEGAAELIEIARRESGGIPVGCSGCGQEFSDEIGQASDIILIHGNGMTRQQFYQYIQKAKKINPKRPIVCNEDSQALSQMQTAMDQGVSWGYYNNMTKQEPPVDWGITAGEDEFYAARMADNLGIKTADIPLEKQFYLQGLEKDMTYEGKRWIRLASLYPEKIHRVDFYRNGKLYESAYDDPFTVNFVNNWLQGPVEGIEAGEEWEARVYLVDGNVISKKHNL